MNKLYCIKCYFEETEYLLATFNFWNRKDAIQKMNELSKWKFEMVCDNETHTIWHGK